MALRRRKKGGNVYFDFVIDGKRVVRSTGTPLFSEAKKVHDNLRGRMIADKFGLPTRRKTIKLFQFCDKYLVKARREKQQSTIEGEEIYINKFKNIVGDKNLHDIDAEDLDRWKSTLLLAVSPTTFNIERRTLQAMFNVAVRWDYLQNNLFKQVAKLRVQEKRLFLTGEELRCLLAVVDMDIRKYENIEERKNFKGVWTKERIAEQKFRNQRFRQFVILSLNTGLRREELLRLRWEDIDFDRNLLYVQKTKDKKSRTVPLTNVARSVLEEVGKDMFGSMTKANVSRKFNHYLEQAGITGMKLHSLRHTFATMLISSGVDIYTVSRLLGHSDIRTTMIYAKLQVGVLEEAITRLSLCYKNVTQEGG